MKDKGALQTIEATSIKRKLKELEASPSDVNGKKSIIVEKQIHEMKRKLRQLKSPITKDRQSAGRCINPKCRKTIRVGQQAVNYGLHGLCCNFKCLSQYMYGK